MPVLLGAALLPSGFAQTPPPLPGAGSTLRETTPPVRPPEAAPSPPAPPAVRAPAARPAGPTFVLREVRFVGATVFDDAALQRLAADRIGKAVTFSDLEAIAQQVTERYRAAGYLVAQAIVPVQDVSAGRVEISVLEGRIGRVRIEMDPAAPIDEARVRAYTARIAPGQPLHEATLGRAMLLLSDLPGVAVTASLEGGEASGSTDLVITVNPERRWSLSFDADNHGSRATSEYRAGVQGRWNSPLRVGDNLDYRLQLGSGGGLQFGRIGYERPVGGQGHRIGLAVTRLEYALGKDFAALDAKGTADVIDLSVTYPVIRSRSRNLFAKLALQQKELQDRFGAVAVVNDKRIRDVTLSLNFESSDRWLGGGYTSAGVTMLAGDLRLQSAEQRAIDQAARRTEGGFTHWSYNLSRLNALTTNANLFIGVAGQISDKNLDSAEKISLGGPRGVRAYAPSEATADEGHIVNAELRYSQSKELSVQGFYDWGHARLNHSPLAVDTVNKVTLHGYGVGLYLDAPGGYALRASLAWRGSARGTADSSDRRPRLYLQLGKAL